MLPIVCSMLNVLNTVESHSIDDVDVCVCMRWLSSC